MTVTRLLHECYMAVTRLLHDCYMANQASFRTFELGGFSAFVIPFFSSELLPEEKGTHEEVPPCRGRRRRPARPSPAAIQVGGAERVRACVRR